MAIRAYEIMFVLDEDNDNWIVQQRNHGELKQAQVMDIVLNIFPDITKKKVITAMETIEKALSK